ncbi:MAG: FtsW/RodA/SpoVE family cell cycle protein [Planctomycetota bacterium]
MARARSIESAGQLTLTGFLDNLARRAEVRDPMVPATRLFLVVLSLMGLGFLLQISHASTTRVDAAFRSELVGQLGFRLGGLALLLGAFRFGPRRLRPVLPHLLVVGFIALVAVFFEPFGAPRNGSHRWLSIANMSFQPSELVRILVVLWIADRCVRLGPRVHRIRRGVLPMLALSFTFFTLILIETDLGGALLLLLCVLSTMWVGGAKMLPVSASLFGVGGGAITLACTFVPYIRNRVSIFFSDVHNDQVSQTLQALGSGGLAGGGLTHGSSRNAGVPYLESDYVFALVGEELGLFGMLLVLGLWCAFLWFALRLVLSLRDRFEALATFGLLLSVALQAMLHVQVVSGLAPPKGMTLPFLSDGGTSLLVSSLAVGLALGAARRSQEEFQDANH